MTRLYDWFFNLFNPDKTSKLNIEKAKIFYDPHGIEPYSKLPNLSQQRIDEILDKINQKGFHNLTSEEKEILAYQ